MKSLPALTAAFLLLSPAAFAQSEAIAVKPTSLVVDPDVPRNQDGKPELEGAVWATNYFPVWDLSPMTNHLVVSEDEAMAMIDKMVAGMVAIPDFQIDPEAHIIIGGTDGLPLVRGERRTRLIVMPADGKVPLTDEARALIKANSAKGDPMDGYEQRPNSERCLVLSGNPPIFATVSYNRLQFIQTQTHVVIHNENGDEARIIPFAEHHGAGPQNWFGDAIARWDEDTLVVETVRQHPDESIRGLFGKFPVTPDATVIERFTRVAKDELLYQFTVEDPKSYAEPWLAEYSFRAVDTGMYPSPCHEHNLSLPNILMGARMADLRASN
jgi:hypothetical protein